MPFGGLKLNVSVHGRQQGSVRCILRGGNNYAASMTAQCVDNGKKIAVAASQNKDIKQGIVFCLITKVLRQNGVHNGLQAAAAVRPARTVNQ